MVFSTLLLLSFIDLRSDDLGHIRFVLKRMVVSTIVFASVVENFFVNLDEELLGGPPALSGRAKVGSLGGERHIREEIVSFSEIIVKILTRTLI